MVNLPSLAHTVLVVPPFECAWLTGENYLLRDGQGCISFEVKGDNDVTVILKPQCGSRRWQHLSASPRNANEPNASPGRSSPVEANYTVILGSHRNSCLKIEKDGDLCHMASNVPGSKLSATSFTKFWVSFNGADLSIGTGDPDPSTVCCRWTDEDPIQNIKFVGLSAWDKHVGYRNIKLHSAVDFSRPTSSQILSGESEPLPTLVELCCRETLSNMDPQNICSVLTVADAIAPVIDGLRARAIESAARQLPCILKEDLDGFIGLTVASLAEILQHQSLVCGEKALFDALVMWAGGTDAVAQVPHPGSIKHVSSQVFQFQDIVEQSIDDDRSSSSSTSSSSSALTSPLPQRSLADVESLLPHVRFPLMSAAELDAVQAHPLHSRSALLQELVSEARRDGILSKGAASIRADRLVKELSPDEAVASARFQRRSPHGCTQLIYMYDGDHNGVCWHIGTRYGSQKWVNPAVAGLLAVRASSPVSRGTDPRALLSGAFLRTNFAGPRRRSNGTGLSSWWALDLGPLHSLECNYYTLRADGSADFLRNWALQGSNDGIEWVELRRHENDQTFKLAGQYASWPVVGPAASQSYRHYRVYLLAPNPEAANPYRVCLSYLELYGNFYVSREKGPSEQ